MRHFLKEKIQKFQVFFQKKVLRFLSLIYSADFRRSRLVLLLITSQRRKITNGPDFGSESGLPKLIISSSAESCNLFILLSCQVLTMFFL